MSHSISRRAALMAGAALPLAASAGLSRAGNAQAVSGDGVELPMHRAFTLGDAKVTTLLASSRVVSDPHSIFELNINDETFAQVSEKNFFHQTRRGSSSTWFWSRRAKT